MFYLICGVSGLLGRELCRQLLKNEDTIGIIGLSRNEYLQWDMAQSFDKEGIRWRDRLQLLLGDIRDEDKIYQLEQDLRHHCNQLVVINLAAYKHVDIAETNPQEYYKTNVIGLETLLKHFDGYSFIHVSSDKACLPSGVYGSSKLDGEKIAVSRGSVVVRPGNYIEAHGNILDLMRRANPVCMCSGMTRFYVSIKDIAKMIISLKRAKSGIYVPKMKAVKIGNLFESLRPDYKPEETKTFRPGEKMHEHLITKSDRPVYDRGDCFYIGRNFSTGKLMHKGFEIVSSDMPFGEWTVDEVKTWSKINT